MSRVEIVEPAQIPWKGFSAHVAAGLEVDQERGPAWRIRHQGAHDEPQLLEVRVGPDELVESHAHREDEVIVVVEGELRLGSRSLGPGSSVAIAGMTLYSFRAGPDGLRFLNFRPRTDETYYPKERFRELTADAVSGRRRTEVH